MLSSNSGALTSANQRALRCSATGAAAASRGSTSAVNTAPSTPARASRWVRPMRPTPHSANRIALPWYSSMPVSLLAGQLGGGALDDARDEVDVLGRVL